MEEGGLFGPQSRPSVLRGFPSTLCCTPILLTRCQSTITGTSRNDQHIHFGPHSGPDSACSVKEPPDRRWTAGRDDFLKAGRRDGLLRPSAAWPRPAGTSAPPNCTGRSPPRTAEPEGRRVVWDTSISYSSSSMALRGSSNSSDSILPSSLRDLRRRGLGAFSGARFPGTIPGSAGRELTPATVRRPSGSRGCLGHRSRRGWPCVATTAGQGCSLPDLRCRE